VTRIYGEEAELYDIAFDWDVDDEVDWLLERLGSPVSVLEPGCGSGRMLEALVRRGVDAVGIDLSPEMLAIAERRAPGRALLADMTDFDLARRFDGAICPINTLAHLAPGDLARHFACMARQLRPGGRYLAQVAVYDDPAFERTSVWEATRGHVRLRVTYVVESPDRHHSRIEILEGPRAGAVLEEEHRMTAWTPETWAAAVAASPFDGVAAYDGDLRERPAVPVGTPGPLMWHELVAVDDGR
jgi:SAM-dependent methyltransferase